MAWNRWPRSVKSTIFNDAISIVVECDDQAELDRYWNALLQGGGQPQACAG